MNNGGDEDSGASDVLRYPGRNLDDDVAPWNDNTRSVKCWMTNL